MFQPPPCARRRLQSDAISRDGNSQKRHKQNISWRSNICGCAVRFSALFTRSPPRPGRPLVTRSVRRRRGWLTGVWSVSRG
eukprot:1195142-Prorocentrum_minimum.AAC.3